MILSVSRRTDIPSFYAEWFINRIKEGYLCVKNPMNIHQVSKIKITPDVVDCIVFWTKNPTNMMKYLEDLKDYMYYFQFTLNSYGKDFEYNVPDKKKVLIPLFKELSNKIGKERVIWRYDPIIFSERYTKEYHLKAFEQIADELGDYTEKCVISFVDDYRKNSKFFKESGVESVSDDELLCFSKELKAIAEKRNIVVASCSEKIDLSECGIEHNSCIDGELIERLCGCKLKVKKDKNQRLECGCVESMEVGSYNTCMNGCRYCYATYDNNTVKANVAKYDAKSEILCGKIMPEDKISERKVDSILERQVNLMDIID